MDVPVQNMYIVNNAVVYLHVTQSAPVHALAKPHPEQHQRPERYEPSVVMTPWVVSNKTCLVINNVDLMPRIHFQRPPTAFQQLS